MKLKLPKILPKDRRGVIATITLLGVSTFALSIMSSIAILALGELKMSNAGALESTYYAAESGLNEALYRLITDPVPGSYSFDFEDNTIVITVEPNPSNPYQRIIRAQATDSTGKVRTVQIVANVSSFAGGFDYAVQGGTGGIFLDNNSLIIGDVYSNGDILPASGGARGDVQGDAWAATFSTIDRVTATGDMHADNITRSTIGGAAFYQTIDISTLVQGNSCNPTPTFNCFPGSPDPNPRPFPIDDSDVQTWKDDITNTGTTLSLNPDDCPVAYQVGTYCVTSNATLGNSRIPGNFYVGNGATLTLTGNLWVTGKIILNNNGTIRLDPSLGGNSVVVIADDIIDVNNNYTIQGSGDPRSFIVMISMSTSFDLAAPAIYASNNSDSIVFAALHGMLKVKNNGALNAAAAESLFLEPNSTVTYNPFLAGFTIPGGGGETVGTSLGTWEEL